MSDWTWEYLPDAENVVGGLNPQIKHDVERLAQRLADAAAVKYLGDPPIHESGVSNLLDHAEGRLIVWYQEHRRFTTVFVVRVQHWPEPDGV
ncbi:MULTISPECIES: hypothetical protein [Streptomyces violaceusniger group]|uniref:Toxin n=2 Tax=Streptomyces violaceusniger group TaxID=2839105 RepID=A0ABD5J9Y9_9ACTN|nr:hypothetical protein [Streptomyces violaceusniger]KUL56687.1 hypothetical protein ADL28_20995 [Streptomyces violaceusniger]MEE4585206.1 hypothetical protein [Streptomyces sp. DSM 41602]